MSFLSQITDAGIAAALAAQAGAVLIDMGTASFSSDLIAQVPSTLRAITVMNNITYTAPANAVTYHVINDNTIMFRVNLPPGVGPFNFGSYSLNLADGTVFAVGSWSSLQTKESDSARYIEQTIIFTGATNTINLTIMNTIDAALPEVPTQADLPTPASAPYPAYLVNEFTPNKVQALATRDLANNIWKYYLPRMDSENAISGASHVYSDSDAGSIIARSNAGANMVDLLPDPSALEAGWERTIKNADTHGMLGILVDPGSSALLDIGKKIHLGPGQNVTIYCDGVNYFTWGRRPDRARCFGGMLDLYCNPSGDDNNTGLSSTNALATLNAAIGLLYWTFDGAGNQATIHLSTGDFNTASHNVITPNFPSNFSYIVISGVGVSTKVSATSGIALAFAGGGHWDLRDFSVEAGGIDPDVYTPLGRGISASFGAIVYIRGIHFGPCGHSHIESNDGGYVHNLGLDYYIYGDAQYHWVAAANGSITVLDGQVYNEELGTSIGTFAYCADGAIINCTGAIFNGGYAIGGQKYNVSYGAIIATGGAGVNYFPGTVAGVNTSGYYI